MLILLPVTIFRAVILRPYTCALASSSGGVPYGPDDGTLAPRAVAASLPFAPEIVLPTLRHFDRAFPEMVSRYGFKCSFNPTFPSGKTKGWIAQGHYALDQGPIVLMIENQRSGLIWELMRGSPHIAQGLRRAGFKEAWLRDGSQR
jgi:hypothetical protein